MGVDSSKADCEQGVQRDGDRGVWLCIGLILVALCACQYVISRQPNPSPSLFVVLQILGGYAYLFAVYQVVVSARRIPFGYMLAVAIICRLILLPSQSLFDNDIYRYLWDGRVLAHGVNPFLYPPSSAALAPLRDGYWPSIGYPEVRTIYPPLAQIIFGLAHALGLRTPLGLKSAFFIFDVANMLLIGALLRRLGRPESWVMVYAWSPLAMKEFANSGHLEPVMLCFLLLALLLWLKERPRLVLAGLSFGAAVLVKLVPVLLLPLAWKLGRWRSLVAITLVIAALYLPFISAGPLLFSGTAVYSKYWVFNYSGYALFSVAERMGLPPARALAGLLVVGYSIWAVRHLRPGDRVGAVSAVRNVLAAFLLLAPTVDPWYVCWLLPLLCFAPNSGLLLLTVSCNVSYLYYVNNAFPVWIPIVEYAPVYLLLAASYLSARHRRKLGSTGVRPTEAG